MRVLKLMGLLRFTVVILQLSSLVMVRSLYVFDELSDKTYLYKNESLYDLPAFNPDIFTIENGYQDMNLSLTFCGPGYSEQRFE